MATRTRPFAVTGAALASAAAVVLATPDLISSHDLSIASGSSVPSPTRLSSANFDLAAFSDISVQGINDAYWFGWGGYVGCGTVNSEGQCTYTPEDIYYPGVNQVYPYQLSGVMYYLADNIIDQFNNDFDLDNYFFEIGWLNSGNPNAGYSGYGALLYVGIGELFGTDSQIFQTAQTILYYGVTNVINSTLVNLVTALVPEIQLGPITVGGGILASLYYFAQTPAGSSVDFSYSTNGLPAVWAYISAELTDLLRPQAAATPAAAGAATLAAPAEETAKTVTDTAKSGLGEVKTEGGAPAAETGTETTEGAPAVDAALTETVTEPTVVTAAAGEGDTTAATDASGTAAGEGVTEASATDTTTTTETTGGSAAGKAPKPKAQSPLGKVASKIRSALGGESTGGKHRADGTGKSSASASASASASDSASSSSESSN